MTFEQRALLRRYEPVLALGLFYLLLGATLRLALWTSFGRPDHISALTLPAILGCGAINDSVAGLYLLLPFALYVLLVPDRWFRSRANRAVIAGGILIWVFGILYLAFTEYYFFQEFDSRFNIVAVDYLVYPTEVLLDIWEAYPVIRVLLLVALASAVIGRMANTYVVRSTSTGVPLKNRLPVFAAHAAILLLLGLFYRTDTLAFSNNRVANELSGNGISSFFRAALTNEIDYGAYYSTRDPAQNLKMLAQQLGAGGGTFVKLAEGRLDREFPARPDGLGKLNVVVVSSESFGAEFSKLYGSEQDLTPNFDAYAQRGVWFSNTYASGTRTVRGLEAISASFPPIPSVSILRRPGNERIATWGSVMRQQGYSTSFLYGGYGYFDNMNYFFGNNGFEVIDRKAIDKVRFENVWGVSDEDLFDKALEHFDAQSARGQPFFSIVMTTSNHKPFTFRKGVPGIPEKGGGRRAGVRYADFALGYFLREAEKHPWFKDTLFVVVADHGARVYGAADIPIKSYEIPLMFYSPAHLSPRRVDALMGQIDIAPTVLGLLGAGYRAPFFGEDVLNAPSAPRIALLSHNHDVAIYKDGRIAVLGLQKSDAVFEYDRQNEQYRKLPGDAALIDLGIAYYQTAFELFKRHQYE